MSELKIKELKLVINNNLKQKMHKRVQPLAIEYSASKDLTPRAVENVIDKWTGGSSGRVTTDLTLKETDRDGVTA